MEEGDALRYIGREFNRVDGIIKADGTHKYPSDMYDKDTLILGVKRAEVPHAKIISIDMEKAKAVPGITAIFTAKDIPGTNRYGIVHKDQEILVEHKVRCIGDPICLVVGENKQSVEKAVKEIIIKYELLEIIRDPFEGLKENAEKIHKNGNLLHHIELLKGDIKKAFKEADLIVDNKYSVPFQDHMPLETEAGFGKIDEDGKLAIWAGTQTIYRDIAEISYALNIPKEDIRVSAPFFGGGFGRKDGITIQLLIALAVIKLRRPVRIFLERSESINSSYHRHAAYMEYKTAFRKDGTILGCQAKLYFDKGAYASLGAEVLNLAVEHFAGPYKIENSHVEGFAVYTNNPIGGAFRGFGVPQVNFAFESQMDIAAEKLNISPLDIRKINVIKQWDTSCIGHTFIYSTGLKECLEALENTELYINKDKNLKTDKIHRRRGLGIAASYQGGGLGVNIPDFAQGKIELCEDGSLIAYGGISDMGQGNTTAYVQIVAEHFNINKNKVRYTTPDSKYTLDSGPASASRTTYIYGKALDGAAKILKDKMLSTAALVLNEDKDNLIICEEEISGKTWSMSFSDIYRYMPKEDRIAICYVDNPIAADKHEIGHGLPHIIYSYAAHMALVEVDMLTGKVEILKYITATDCGKVINPQSLKGQIQGGAAQGIGYALYEGLKLKDSKVLNNKMSTYIIPSIMDVPEIETFHVETYEATGAFGMKGVGEISIDAPAPAISNAIYNAAGYRCYSLPITAEKIILKDSSSF
ncbi:aldehyde oxidase and xanthine dehydrogenase, molybdopterin binding domain protein [Clostridiales bacterium oral taxon 876 str. F0540]|nr:aldehyde oxidase and xanthine dehydrogenase, molybdopterin binding domain protein [Clostridiales bacterium oral taxon 876 str. F0540]